MIDQSEPISNTMVSTERHITLILLTVNIHENSVTIQIHADSAFLDLHINMGVHDLSFHEIKKGTTANMKKDLLNSSVASFCSPVKAQLNGTLKTLFNSFGLSPPDSICRRCVFILYLFDMIFNSYSAKQKRTIFYFFFSYIIFQRK